MRARVHGTSERTHYDVGTTASSRLGLLVMLNKVRFVYTDGFMHHAHGARSCLSTDFIYNVTVKIDMHT